MAHVYSKGNHGLLVARDTAPGDEQAVARQLRDYDPDLRLVPQGVVGRQIVYKVYRYAGSDRPAEFVCFWGDEATGEPWPLSSGLLDRVRELDKNTRANYLSAEAREARRRAELERHREQTAKDVYDDLRRMPGRLAALPRGQSLRRARSRSGYHDA